MLNIIYNNEILSKEELLKRISYDNQELNPKRCGETYLIKHNLLESLNYHTSDDFTTIKDKIFKLRYDGGYCIVCGKRTKIDNRGFRLRCEEHKFQLLNKKITFNDIVPDIVKELYEQGEPISKLAKIYNTSHQSIKNKLLFLGVKLRTHKENQSIQASKNKKDFKYQFTKEFWLNEYNNKTSPQIAKEIGCCETTVLNMLRFHNIEIKPTFSSSQENKICEFLDTLNINYIRNDRYLINQELDIYIPEHNISIECNGIYWHSSLFKDKNYHLNKTLECEKQDIRLLHFWDSEIDNQFDIIKSMIKAKCNLIPNKIHARKCVIKQISTKIAKEFTNRTHLQGHCNASVYLGLYYNDVLVSVASFAKPRFNKNKNMMELIRFSTELDTIVIGGLSKVIKYIKNNNNCSILSYANRRWSSILNNTYNSSGFELSGISSPNYFYTSNFRTLENRMKYQKHKLKHFDNYSDNKTETQIMFENGYHQIHDCGNLTYILN